MPEIESRMVRYDIWCSKCQYETANENDDPCEECLSNPTNQYTEKPTNFKENQK